MRLGAAINFYLWQRARDATGIAVGLAGFLNRFKKGAKQIRKILITKTNPPYNDNVVRTLNYYNDNVITLNSLDLFALLTKTWIELL